jgi:hypothetical protein
MTTGIVLDPIGLCIWAHPDAFRKDAVCLHFHQFFARGNSVHKRFLADLEDACDIPASAAFHQMFGTRHAEMAAARDIAQRKERDAIISPHNRTVRREGVGVLKSDRAHFLLPNPAVARDDNLELVDVMEMRINPRARIGPLYQEALRFHTDRARRSEIITSPSHTILADGFPNIGFRRGNCPHHRSSSWLRCKSYSPILNEYPFPMPISLSSV